MDSGTGLLFTPQQRLSVTEPQPITAPTDPRPRPRQPPTIRDPVIMNLQPPRPPLHGKRHWSSLSILSRRSFRSFTTSSFEADDERSSGDSDAMSSRSSSTAASDRRRRTAAALHAGYDGRPTSGKEMTGWYMYAFASETYVICGIGMSALSSRVPRVLMRLTRPRRFVYPHSPREPRPREWSPVLRLRHALWLQRQQARR